MAAVTAGAPSGRRSLLGKASAALSALSGRKTGKPSRLAAAAAAVREHVVTVAALGAFDLGAFQVRVPHLGHAPGLVALSLSLLALDFAVRG